VLALATCTPVANAPKSVASTPEETEARAGIVTTLTEHAAAVKAGDGKAAAGIFADDGVFVVGEHETRGRAALESLEEENLRGLKVLDMHFSVRAIHVSRDFAYTFLDYAGNLQRNNKSPEISRGTMVATWRRQSDGAWRVHYLIYYP
jgi:uncharacterized protein (TIGR02246 family)